MIVCDAPFGPDRVSNDLGVYRRGLLLCIIVSVSVGVVTMFRTGKASAMPSAISRKSIATGLQNTRNSKRNWRSNAVAAPRSPRLASNVWRAKPQLFDMPVVRAEDAVDHLGYPIRPVCVPGVCGERYTTVGQAGRSSSVVIGYSDYQVGSTKQSIAPYGKHTTARSRLGVRGTSTTRTMTGLITASKIWS